MNRYSLLFLLFIDLNLILLKNMSNNRRDQEKSYSVSKSLINNKNVNQDYQRKTTTTNSQRM